MIDKRYQQTLDYIYSFVDYEKEARPRDAAHYDLRRMDELLARLGNPHLKSKAVHVAGTKGKGSTSVMIASALVASGYNTGLYTSPHLLTFNERIQVNGKLISDEDVVTLTDKLRPEVAAVNEKATYGKLTTFEVMTALAFEYFKLKGADFQVIEVGLGGRLDATNVINPEVAVITSISYDHMEVLGNTLTEIATEKAGIIKPGSTVAIAPQPYGDEVDRVFEGACRINKAKLIRVGRDVTWECLSFDSTCQSLRVKGRLDDYELSIPLLGQHQLENAATAVAALEVLVEKGFHVSRNSIAEGLSKVDWPGRLQILRREPLLIVDGAHNADSARKLRLALEQYFTFEQAILIMGTSFDKDIAGIVSELAPLFSKVIVTRSAHPRAMATSHLVAEFSRHGVEAQSTNDISIALRRALSLAGDKDLICATGSLFIVAEVMEQVAKLKSV
ncbi:MAG: bifunctional folylpolyglutamate synthase/dihydrofolate synthase [Dehalococcoidales bacterium]|nr:bifunctional folylpolyglutamate synthase/dihydrofolate synthase [Dehalococcoidales bacterium]